MGNKPARHLVLLGDSTIDNGNWTSGPCVTDQVRQQEPLTTMCALDGALIAAVCEQVRSSPEDATHYIVSVGGNNATGATTTVLGEVGDAEEAIIRLHTFVQTFELQFSSMIEQLVQAIHGKPLIVCSCYNPCFAAFDVTTVGQEAANTTMALIADAILRVATRFKLPVIDWRRVMTQVEDFANPIEPSSIGGAKMASCIVSVVRNHPFELNTTVVYPQDYPESHMVMAAMPKKEDLSWHRMGQKEGCDLQGAQAEDFAVQQSVLDNPESAATAANLRGPSNLDSDVTLG